MILSDGLIGQVMEKVELFDPIPRKTEFNETWVLSGKTSDRPKHTITSLDLDPVKMEKHNLHLQSKYRAMEENEVRYEAIHCDDAEYLFVAYGASARICLKAVQLARDKGIKVGLLRPITLFPFPTIPLLKLADKVKRILTVEMSAGQMIEDVRLAVNGKVKVDHYGRYGGMIHSPIEVLQALENQLINI